MVDRSVFVALASIVALIGCGSDAGKQAKFRGEAAEVAAAAQDLAAGLRAYDVQRICSRMVEPPFTAKAIPVSEARCRQYYLNPEVAAHKDRTKVNHWHITKIKLDGPLLATIFYTIGDHPTGVAALDAYKVAGSWRFKSIVD